MENLQNQNAKRGKALVGIIFIAIGCLLLLNQIGLSYPSWILSGPMFLIALGTYLGVKHQFKNSAPYILIGLGAILLFKKIFDINSDVIWPIIIIGAGIWLIFFRGKGGRFGNSRYNWNRNKYDWDKRSEFGTFNGGTEQPENAEFQNATSDDIIDSTSIFGGVKKNVLSKNFKGGDITNFFGGAEINLMHADIQNQAVLDVTQVFGGTKIIIPANWIVKSEMVAIFGSIEDRRPTFNQEQSQKVLIIKGTSIFAGIDVKSY